MRSLSQLSLSQEQRAATARNAEDEGKKEKSERMKNFTHKRMHLSLFSDSDTEGDSDKNNGNELRNQDNNCTLYKLSKYLRMPRRLLLHSLQLQFGCNRLKWKKKERRFLFERLQLLDRQFYLQQIRFLYQFYFDQGSKYQIWPVSCRVILGVSP